MSQLTEEQQRYVDHDNSIDTKLIATAGSGKTFTIIQKMKKIIEDNIFTSDEVLMLTFSRFTRDDFIRRIVKCKIDNINTDNIKTIDSFAKSIIDPNNEVDVSILSYKFMKYLERTPSKIIQENEKLKNIKTIFVDEAQDLNETQFKILYYMKKKNKSVINLIGDPNQNIYQFRGSSDKYMTNFQAKTFFLTYNFRSHKEVVQFSKYLRPNQDVDILCKKDKINKLPTSVIYKNEDDLKKTLIGLLKNATNNGIDLSDFAILAPTRGRMRSNGKSNGLCLITNMLYENGYKFKQFYEEGTEEINNNIQYNPEPGHINILTFMGSKGLEWKYTIIIDAETCLINKRHFTKEKHKNDQYLLYVACSRAIQNLFIFSKYSQKCADHIFSLNPWFSLIPPNCYKQDHRYEELFNFQEIKEKICVQDEKRIGKILEQCSEEDLYKLALLCDYGVENGKTIKHVTNIYDVNPDLSSTMFISKFTKELFLAYYNIIEGIPHKKYSEIENIKNLDTAIKKFSPQFLEWYFWNKKFLTWEKFDNDKKNYNPEFAKTIEKYFDRNKDLGDHIIVPDCYFKSFILGDVEDIKANYEKYLACKDKKKIKKYLFNIIVILYSLETQHYYHVLNKGEKFKYVLSDYDEVFENIYKFLNKRDIGFKNVGVPVCKHEMNGEIDFINNSGEIFNIRCCSDITLKHIVNQILCYIIHFNLDDSKKNKHDIKINFINLITGEMIKISLTMTTLKIKKIIDIFIKNKKSKN